MVDRASKKIECVTLNNFKLNKQNLNKVKKAPN